MTMQAVNAEVHCKFAVVMGTVSQASISVQHATDFKQTNWLQSGNTPSSDNTASSLDVVIEAEVLVAHLFQDGKGLVGLEVLKLDEAVGEAMLSCCTELFHHLHVLITCQPLLLAALQGQVRLKPDLMRTDEWLCSKCALTVCAQNRQRFQRTHPCCSAFGSMLCESVHVWFCDMIDRSS